MDIKLKRVRLSFPAIFKPKAVNDGEPRYSASFLLDKKEDADQIKAVRDMIAAVAKEKFKGKIPRDIKVCIHDGDEKEYDGYNDKIKFISASSTVRPTVVDVDRSPLTEEDGKPYAGCYVNVVLRFWAQDNKWGKRVNAQLKGIQFAGDGEAFGEKPLDAKEAFDDISDKVPKTDAPAKEAAPDPDDDEDIPF